MKKQVYFDCDGVLLSWLDPFLTFLSHNSSKYLTHLPQHLCAWDGKNIIKNYHMDGLPWKNRFSKHAAVRDFARTSWHMYRDGIFYGIPDLLDKDFEIFALTSNHAHTDVFNAVNAHYPSIKGTYYVQDKLGFINDTGGGFLIDDDPHVLKFNPYPDVYCIGFVHWFAPMCLIDEMFDTGARYAFPVKTSCEDCVSFIIKEYNEIEGE